MLKLPQSLVRTQRINETRTILRQPLHMAGYVGARAIWVAGVYIIVSEEPGLEQEPRPPMVE
jgi:hypothetical protein